MRMHNLDGVEVHPWKLLCAMIKGKIEVIVTYHSHLHSVLRYACRLLLAWDENVIVHIRLGQEFLLVRIDIAEEEDFARSDEIFHTNTGFHSNSSLR